MGVGRTMEAGRDSAGCSVFFKEDDDEDGDVRAVETPQAIDKAASLVSMDSDGEFATPAAALLMLLVEGLESGVSRFSDVVVPAPEEVEEEEGVSAAAAAAVDPLLLEMTEPRDIAFTASNVVAAEEEGVEEEGTGSNIETCLALLFRNAGGAMTTLALFGRVLRGAAANEDAGVSGEDKEEASAPTTPVNR